MDTGMLKQEEISAPGAESGTKPEIRVLVTGATGFIGSALLVHLAALPHVSAMGTARSGVGHGSGANLVPIGAITPDTDWSAALEHQDVVVHLAAMVPGAKPGASLDEYRQVNVAATLNLARQAVAAGVRRFVFLSTIKVNGEGTGPDQAFTPADKPDPQGSYAFSKSEAESGLRQLAAQTGLELVIIRPPLVYGPGVKGGFLKLIKLTRSRLPLPFALVDNRRSLLGLANLVDFITLCIEKPAASGHTFMVADAEDLSTPELLRRLGQALNRRVRLVPVPVSMLEAGARLLGCQALAQPLLGSLRVDAHAASTLLGWQPRTSIDTELERCCARIYKRAGSVHAPAVLRGFDVICSGVGLVLGLPLYAMIALLGYFDTGSPLFRQQRVGRNQKPFTLLKFRTMQPDTASVATHLADAASITRLGRFLRRTKLDELPQLWNVFKGDMSLVGPRPCLYNQQHLIEERARRGVFDVRPGITGLAQVRGIDMSTPELLAKTDAQMLQDLTLSSYLHYIFMTLAGRGSGDRAR